ncbi:MAG: NAD(P)-binding domain-containing protein [Pseudomonadota bacterium]
MEIGIIGTGNVGCALANGWASKGHNIVLGARDPAKAKPLADTANATIVAPKDIKSEVIVLATPWAAALEIISQVGDLSGRIVIDCTNPLGRIDGRFDLMVGHTISGAEEIAAAAPKARIVKTLNQVGAEIIASANTISNPPAMFMAADDDDAKTSVHSLLLDLGFDPLDAGGLTKARLLEPLALVWINQALAQGKGRQWALTVQEVTHD